MYGDEALRNHLGVPAQVGHKLTAEELRELYQDAVSRLERKLSASLPPSALRGDYAGDDRDIAAAKLIEHLFAEDRPPAPDWLPSV